MKVFPYSFQNSVGYPNEDFYLISKNQKIFILADGVTRMKNKNGSYPKVSGAKLAAEEFCKTAANYLEKNFKEANLKTLEGAFNFGNKAIFNLNEKCGINKKLDYLENDYFCTCAIAAFIKNNILYYGCVGDCGIRIYDKNDFLKLASIDDVAILEDWRNGKNFKTKKEKLLIWRKFLRNKPKAPYLTYGVLTGEPEAEHYYRFGKIKLQRSDLIFIHSDGFLRFVKQAELRKLFRVCNRGKLSEEINNFVNEEISKNSKDRILDDKTLISILK